MPRVTLGLDARTIHRPARRGTGRNLIDLYRRVLELRPDWRVIGYHRTPTRQGGDEAPAMPDGYEAKCIEMPGDRFNAWVRWRLPFAAMTDRLDLLHCPANECPIWNPTATLLTIHDLLPLEADAAAAQRFRRSVLHAKARRLPVITPSRFTADQLIERFGLSEDQITVNPWAADTSMRYMPDTIERKAVCRRYNAGGRFVLHFGASEQRKNTLRVLEAYALLPAGLRAEWTLVIVGLDDEPTRLRVIQQAIRLQVGGTVQVCGFAPEEDLPALMSAAEVLAYPSLSEGFGLPIVDAWATRTAVVTSRTTSLPEVAGDAAELVGPTDANDIAEGLKRVLGDEAYRRSLVARGERRARLFTWEATANRFIATVERVLGMGQDERRGPRRETERVYRHAA